MTASWHQLSVKTPAAAHDIVANYLIERGSPGVVSRGHQVRAYFPASMNASSLEADIRRFLKGIGDIYPGVGSGTLHWKNLVERNWNSSWRKYFTVLRIGRSLLIKPPWLKPQRIGRRQVINLEPGMAFGTGTHATTRGCLEFLEEVVVAGRGRDLKALDVGTGSGILAIALAKMGVNRVVALDLDPVAVKVARENLQRNEVEEFVCLKRAGVEGIHGNFGVVVANLTAEPIIELAPKFRRRVSRGGHLILSGILGTQKTEVATRFVPDSFVLLRQKRRGEWVTLHFQKSS
ncbi:MAG: 50S ribosomal protein L11 methyltransferase [Nitrospinae bacterium]|nr:50S ribosomal protein L11 methyltransferase [Nitrospinota bacterium]